jgi:phosphate transport system substrate-binding protein
MKQMNSLVKVLYLSMLLVACGSQQQVEDTRDTPNKGTIYISVEESFRPVIEEQIKVYEASFPGTHIVAAYKPEVECMRDLQKDSTRMVIVARGLNQQEAEYYQQQLSYKPLYGILAYDAVAVIINKAAKDSVFTMQAIKDILSGKQDKTAVMDGKNATGTVRFLKDSVLRGANFGKNVVAAANSQEVVDIVSKRADVIGFVGLGWIGDNYDPKQEAYRKLIRLALVECVLCPEKEVFAKPSQSTITYGQYPLARPLCYILKENATGLGTGFMNFMGLERGQLIFRRAFLAPAKMNLSRRSGKIKESE